MATCEDCRFYQKPVRGLGPDGCCYRYPPRVVALLDPEHIGDLRQQSPVVAACNWCGEHQPAKPDAAEGISQMALAIEPFLVAANAMQAEPNIMIQLDLLDDNGDPISLQSNDFIRLAEAFAKATGS